MKREIIDNYEVYSENGKMRYIGFEDSNKKKHYLKMSDALVEELTKRKQEQEHERYLYRAHHGRYLLDYELIGGLEVLTHESAEVSALNKIFIELVVNEIYKLPYSQNKRAYMFLIEGKTYSEIAMLEDKHRATIKRSIDVALEKIKTRIKKI